MCKARNDSDKKHEERQNNMSVNAINYSTRRCLHGSLRNAFTFDVTQTLAHSLSLNNGIMLTLIRTN